MTIESAISGAVSAPMFSLGYTFAEEPRFEGGEVLDRNFDTYEIPRFSWVPEIETVGGGVMARRSPARAAVSS